MSHFEDNDAMSRELHADEMDAKLRDLESRLQIMARFLTVTISRLGGEVAMTTTEIERAVMGQQIAVTELPNSRGYYVSLVTHDPNAEVPS